MTTPLTPYARLPRSFSGPQILSSTVDVFGRAHWLVSQDPTGPHRTPYDAVVVTVDEGTADETYLHALQATTPMLDALPDGGFVVAAARSGPTVRGTHDERQVQIFDLLGRETHHFRVGDAIEHLLADEHGDLWIGYFDEGIFGDPLSACGLARWSAQGELRWAYSPVSGAGHISDCYALNVDRRAAWACPYTDFPLLEIRADRVARVRTTPLSGATGLAVCGERFTFFGGYGPERDRLTECRLDGNAATPVGRTTLVHPDGSSLGRRRLVCRGARIYVQDERSPDWEVLDLSGR